MNSQVKGLYAPLIVEHLDFYWKLVEPFSAVVTLDKNEKLVFFVPDQFITDFASVPRIFWSLIPPATGRHAKAAVLHDWLYYTALVDKDTADKIFYRLMLEIGVPKVKALTMYLAVKYFGFEAWYRHRDRGHSLEQWLKVHGKKSKLAQIMAQLNLGYIVSPMQIGAYANSDAYIDLSEFVPPKILRV